ncbi:ATPase, T2SS/T4P/T4SS family [Brevibacillus reuszeri]|uniref:ATPase, T2SS/T4P/T4SS family n=1 Tax=Brevibacillus reuszeri TaxID=54915 RepID=UPI003D2187F4
MSSSSATRISLKDLISLVTEYYKDLKEVSDAGNKEDIRQWITSIQTKDDNSAKQNLISDLTSVLDKKNIVLGDEHVIYPEVPAIEGIVFRIYGLGVYDAITHKSPTIESVWLGTDQIARYVEHGITKSYHDYIPDESEMEAIQSRLEEICQEQHNPSEPILRGFIESSETRIQSYMPPRTYSRIVRTRRFITPSFSLDDIKMDERAREFSKQAMYGRLNICLAGGQGTGKTTRQIGLLILKDPTTENITIYETEHEMRFQKKWPGTVAEIQDINDMGFAAVYRDVFRNGSQTICFAEPREGIEAHYALISCGRGSDQTVLTTHIRIPDLDDPVSGIREFATLVNEHRNTNINDIYRNIASGIDLFWILENLKGNRVDYCIFVPEMEEDSVSPTGDYVPPKPKARVLAKYDFVKKGLVWTGEHLADHKVRYMTNKGTADLEILRELGLTDLKREV